MKPIIYEPKGAAREYAPLAVNLYRGCLHGCAYCYAPACLRMPADAFHEEAAVRPFAINRLEEDAVKLLSRKYEERRTADRRRLDGMIQYSVQTEQCRVAVIRNYFEDGEPTPCGHCDICEPKLRRRRRRSKKPSEAARRTGAPQVEAAEEEELSDLREPDPSDSSAPS